jgi:hypothetical protein
MTSFIRSLVGVCVTGVFALLPSVALAAGSKALALKVTGSIAAAPAWQDAASAPITELSFAFSGIAGTTANVEVASATVDAKLVNAPSYPASISLSRPKSCTIGSDNVADADVIFKAGATPLSTDAAFNISSNATVTFGLAFAATGNYGDKAGAVSCTTDGSMTYTY